MWRTDDTLGVLFIDAHNIEHTPTDRLLEPEPTS